jgi:hypothetical protein
MAEVKFRKRRAYVYGVFGFVALLTLPLASVALWDIAAWGTGRQVMKYDSSGTPVFLLALQLGLGALLSWHFSNRLSVRFTTEGVGQRGFGGWKQIAWGEVTHLNLSGYELYIHKGRDKVIITRLAYADWEEVARFIVAQAPEGPTPQVGP